MSQSQAVAESFSSEADPFAQLDAQGNTALAVLGEKPNGRRAKSNTERSRQYRLAKRQSGGAELSVFINAAASAALRTIAEHHRCTQAHALELALTALALQCAPVERS